MQGVFTTPEHILETQGVFTTPEHILEAQAVSTDAEHMLELQDVFSKAEHIELVSESPSQVFDVVVSQPAMGKTEHISAIGKHNLPHEGVEVKGGNGDGGGA